MPSAATSSHCRQRCPDQSNSPPACAPSDLPASSAQASPHRILRWLGRRVDAGRLLASCSLLLASAHGRLEQMCALHLHTRVGRGPSDVCRRAHTSVRAESGRARGSPGQVPYLQAPWLQVAITDLRNPHGRLLEGRRCTPRALSRRPVRLCPCIQTSQPVPPDLAKHLSNFLSLVDSSDQLTEFAAPMIASTLLLDSYPPGTLGTCHSRCCRVPLPSSLFSPSPVSFLPPLCPFSPLPLSPSPQRVLTSQQCSITKISSTRCTDRRCSGDRDLRHSLGGDQQHRPVEWPGGHGRNKPVSLLRAACRRTNGGRHTQRQPRTLQGPVAGRAEQQHMSVLPAQETTIRPALRTLTRRELRGGVRRAQRGRSLGLPRPPLLPLPSSAAERRNREGAPADGRSRRHVHRWRRHTRDYGAGADEADPRSHRPADTPAAVRQDSLWSQHR